MSRAVSYMAARQQLSKNDLEVIGGCAKTLRESAAPVAEEGGVRTDAPPDPDDIAAFIARRKSGGRDA